MKSDKGGSMQLSKLLETVGGELVGDNVEVFSLNVDSRKRVENSLFICLVGNNTDSHNYAAMAKKNGAVALVVERVVDVALPQVIVPNTRIALGKIASAFYGEPSKSLKIVGVTGTNGKTTTAQMLASIWRAAGKKVGVVGTLGVEYGRKRFPTQLTTPDPIELQQTLADMLISGVEYVVMEVSAHALYYNKVEGIRFVACVFTNLTQDHLDFFPSMKEYGDAKRRLFDKDRCSVAIINGDDPFARKVGQECEKCCLDTLYYGMETPTDSFAVITKENLLGTECLVNINDYLSRVFIPIAGMHNVYNALAASTCAVVTDCGEYISKGLSELKGVPGRLEYVRVGQPWNVYVDFAHTPDGLQRSLETLRKYCNGKLICVFGCGGNRDAEKRPLMGEIAARKADFAVLTSDNPRYEDPLDIISAIEKGYRRCSSRYVIIPNRRKAISYALDMLEKEDVLLLAGKGGEDFQEIMGIKYPFNDYTVVEELLAESKSKIW